VVGFSRNHLLAHRCRRVGAVHIIRNYIFRRVGPRSDHTPIADMAAADRAVETCHKATFAHAQRMERGFDFLGYHFSPTGLRVAMQTITNFIEKASRLYEQERRAGLTAHPLEMYVRRWLWWPVSGLRGLFLARFYRPTLKHTA